MNFKLKTLVAALILAASVPAHAAIDYGNSAAKGSSMLLTVIDMSNGISASFDLGKNYSDFSVVASSSFANSGVEASGTSFSWDFTTGDYASAWSAFTASANLANTKWSVVGADSLGGLLGSGYVATYAGTPAAMSSTTLTTAVTKFDQQLLTALSTIGNISTAENGAAVATSGNAYGGFSFNSADNKFYSTGPIISGALNSSLGVMQATGGATALAPTKQYVFGNGAQFLMNSTGQLAYSTAAVITPVPEADTSAMLLAGLGLMGFIARRRNKNA